MVPEGWRQGRLAEVAHIILGQSPASADVSEAEIGFPFLQGNAEFGERHPSARGWIANPPRTAPPESILISVRAPVGDVNRADAEYAIGRGLAAVAAQHAAVSQEYLFWTLANAQAYFRSREQGSTFDAINKGDLLELPLLLPPLAEQQKIAAILSSVDDAITATRKVIEQTKRVKQGLLETLMTNGIGHARFKETEIGEIPEGWGVVQLEDVASRGSGHTPSKTFPEYWDGGIRWVSLADSHRLDRVYLDDTERTISLAGVANSSAVIHPTGTVFVSRDASVGRSAIAACELAVSQHFIAWQCGDRLNNHFLYYFLQYHKPQFERIAVGSTIKTIGLGYFKRLRIPLPPPSEQERIADMLGSVRNFL
jgi:type I restriction enzyme S subunit